MQAGRSCCLWEQPSWGFHTSAGADGFPLPGPLMDRTWNGGASFSCAFCHLHQPGAHPDPASHHPCLSVVDWLWHQGERWEEVSSECVRPPNRGVWTGSKLLSTTSWGGPFLLLHLASFRSPKGLTMSSFLLKWPRMGRLAHALPGLRLTQKLPAVKMEPLTYQGESEGPSTP